MKDIYIEDFDGNKSIDFIDSQEQQAVNWVKLGNKQIFSTFGVDYYNFITSTDKKYEISIGALANFIQQELSKNFIYCSVIPQNTGTSTEIFKIEVINGI